MRQALLLALLTLAGCPAASEVVQVDAGPISKTRSACEPEAQEDCQGCFQALATCCYGPGSIDDRVAMLVARCESVPSCRACCNECKRLTCDQHVAANDCPNK
jgi:hypothetical protein